MKYTTFAEILFLYFIEKTGSIQQKNNKGEATGPERLTENPISFIIKERKQEVLPWN